MQSAIRSVPFDIMLEPTWHPQEYPPYGVEPYIMPAAIDPTTILSPTDFKEAKTLEGWCKLTGLQRQMQSFASMA